MLRQPSASESSKVMGSQRREAAMTTQQTNTRIIRSPRGTEMTAKTWAAEAALRMLMNNLDPEVAEQVAYEELHASRRR
jgi:hypothetical protein